MQSSHHSVVELRGLSLLVKNNEISSFHSILSYHPFHSTLSYCIWCHFSLSRCITWSESGLSLGMEMFLLLSFLHTFLYPTIFLSPFQKDSQCSFILHSLCVGGNMRDEIRKGNKQPTTTTFPLQYDLLFFHSFPPHSIRHYLSFFASEQGMSDYFLDLDFVYRENMEKITFT